MMVPIAILYLSFVVFVLTGPQGGWIDELFNHYVYNALILIPAFACFHRAYTVRREAVAWTAIGLGCVAYFLGETYWAFVLSDAEVQPYPSIADFFYLGLYPFLLLGIVLLVRQRVTEISKSMWLHGLVAAFAVAALDAAIVVDAVGSQDGLDTGALATNITYVISDLFLLMIVTGVWALTTWRPSPIWRLLGVSFLLLAIGDSIYFYQALTDSYVEGGFVDLLWPAAMLLLYVAAAGSTDRVRQIGAPGHWTIIPTVAFSMLAIGLLVWDHFNQLGMIALVFSTAAVVMAVFQMSISLSENLRLLNTSREEAFTDQLTGMHNRRRLLVDLEWTCEVANEDDPQAFVMFDLNGFKEFNDHFGHPAGDALLRRLGMRLMQAVAPVGSAYRLGGDEFCVIARVKPVEVERFVADASAALTEHGHTYDVTPAFGSVAIPFDARTAPDVLRVADRRMYENKAELKEAAANADPLRRLIEHNTEQLDTRGGLGALEDLRNPHAA
jgi:diguanylate cyclase (GGDEF)-like protein